MTRTKGASKSSEESRVLTGSETEAGLLRMVTVTFAVGAGEAVIVMDELAPVSSASDDGAAVSVPARNAKTRGRRISTERGR